MIGSLTRLAERRCYHCRNFVGDARYGHCRLDPPTVSPLLAEHPSAKREAEFVVRNRAGDVDCNYPPVTPTTCWCRRGYARHWRRWLNFPFVARMLNQADAK